MVRHVLTMDDLTSDETREVLRLSADLKHKYKNGTREDWVCNMGAQHCLQRVIKLPSLKDAS